MDPSPVADPDGGTGSHSDTSTGPGSRTDTGLHTGTDSGTETHTDSGTDPDVDDSPASIYRGTLAAAERALAAGTYHPDTPPVDGAPRWGISVVIRVDGPVRDRLARVLADLRALRRSPHLVYRPADLHCTVRSLEGHQRVIPPGRARRHADRIVEAAAGLPPLRLRVRGLGGSPGGLFACGYPTPALRTLRVRLGELAAVDRATGAAGVPGGDADRIRDTAHVSLLVFAGPVVAEPELLGHLAAHQQTEFGVLDVGHLSVVRYDWTLGQATGTPTGEGGAGMAAAVSMTELARVPLTG